MKPIDDQRPAATAAASTPMARPPPIAQIWRVRGRPSRTSARCPQAGTAMVKPIAPTDVMRPICRRAESEAGEDHRDERVEDAERDADGGDDDEEGDHATRRAPSAARTSRTVGVRPVRAG